MRCRPVIFDPPEWLYVYTMAQAVLPQLSYHKDREAAETASHMPGLPVDVLRDFDWGSPAVYMPPFEKVVGGSLVVAVEGYTAKKLARRGVKPDVVVGDWDFEPEGAALGRIAVVHAHGDNYWRLPRGPYIYTVQTWPVGCTANVSGFTDGDRAVYLAYYMGAREITVSGFYPHVSVKRDDEAKRKKLKIAAHLLERLARRISIRFL